MTKKYAELCGETAFSRSHTELTMYESKQQTTNNNIFQF